jgi:RND family efflux transporter MFP subunit
MPLLTLRSHKAFRPLAIIAIAIVASYLLYISRPEQVQQAQPKSRLFIDAVEVQSATRQITISSQGTVLPRTETELSSEVQGRVIAVADHFVAGGFVQQGDLLLRIDDLEYRTAVARAQAAVAASNTRLAEERGRADVAYQDWLRYNKEGKRSAQAKSLALREPQIAEASANLYAAKADLAKAEENLARTQVIAPYDGLIRQRSVDLGQHVSVGMALGICFSTGQVEVRLPVAESKLSLLALPSANKQATQNTPIQLTVSLNNIDHHWQAQLVRVESVIDDRSRMLHLVASVDDPYQLKSPQAETNKPLLRVGTFVSALITGKALDNIVRIPHDVLQTDSTVWLIDSNGQLQRRAVNIIANDNTYAYVDSGLASGDKIAIGYIDSGNIGNQVSIAKLIKLPANNADHSSTAEQVAIKASAEDTANSPAREI